MGDDVTKTLGTKRHQALIALLVEKREAKGLTQTDLAAKLGEYQSFVARLESGQRRVDVIEWHRKVKGLRSRISRAVFAYAACKHAISFHTCMAAVLSSRYWSDGILWRGK